MNAQQIENLLRHARHLPLSNANVSRSHRLQKRVCPDCETESVRVNKHCSDRLCIPCRSREYRALDQQLRSLHVRPSHFVHLILPVRAVPLHKLRPAHIDALQNAIATIRRHTWFKKALSGGCYVLELDLSHDLWIRPHAPMLVETVKSAKAKPIDVSKANAAWQQLTGQSVQVPRGLKKYTTQDVQHVLRYVAKKIHGESELDVLKELEDYVNDQNAELHIYRHEKLYRAYVKELEDNVQIAQRLRATINKIFNDVLRQKQRRAFFGKWRGKKIEKEQKKFPAQRRCHNCGSVEPSEFATLVKKMRTQSKVA
jgi:hypothetical protein